jgi:hypothetical protein
MLQCSNYKHVHDAPPSATINDLLKTGFLSNCLTANTDAFHMDGECDLKQRASPPSTATLPLPTLISCSITIDAPGTILLCFVFFASSVFFHCPAAPSANTQSFDATIEVNGLNNVLGKSSLLLQGVNLSVLYGCAVHFRLAALFEAQALHDTLTALSRHTFTRHPLAPMWLRHCGRCVHGS